MIQRNALSLFPETRGTAKREQVGELAILRPNRATNLDRTERDEPKIHGTESMTMLEEFRYEVSGLVNHEIPSTGS
jgi:hypothetical protein